MGSKRQSIGFVRLYVDINNTTKFDKLFDFVLSVESLQLVFTFCLFEANNGDAGYFRVTHILLSVSACRKK